MITITNKEILDYLVRKIINGKRTTPRYIKIDNNGLKIVWRNGKVTTRNIFSRMSIENRSMTLLLVNRRNDEIAGIEYVINEIIQ